MGVCDPIPHYPLHWTITEPPPMRAHWWNKILDRPTPYIPPVLSIDKFYLLSIFSENFSHVSKLTAWNSLLNFWKLLLNSISKYLRGLFNEIINKVWWFLWQGSGLRTEARKSEKYFLLFLVCFLKVMRYNSKFFYILLRIHVITSSHCYTVLM